mmetsp:Transcript_32896/g.83297  ORF Transcript_32896/g.83297 Transcript_32896/m.83297 type:complete len:263 (-) Transcript_32896:1149-1937(-)
MQMLLPPSRPFRAAVALGDWPPRLEARFVRTVGVGLPGPSCNSGPEARGREAARGARGGGSHGTSSPGSGSCKGGGPINRMLQGAEEARGAGGACGASIAPTSSGMNRRGFAFLLFLATSADAAATAAAAASGVLGAMVRRPREPGRVAQRSLRGCDGLTTVIRWKSSMADARVKFAASSFSMGGCGAAGATGAEGKQSTGKGSSPGGASRGRKRRAKALRLEGGTKACADGNSKPGPSSLTSMGPKPSVAPQRAPSKRSQT